MKMDGELIFVFFLVFYSQEFLEGFGAVETSGEALLDEGMVVVEFFALLWDSNHVWEKIVSVEVDDGGENCCGRKHLS